MKTPEYVLLSVCPWVRLHHERLGDDTCMNIGGQQFSVVDLQLNEHHFPNCSTEFVFELTSYFPDRILSVDCGTCPACQEELDKEMNTAIINAHGIPPITA